MAHYISSDNLTRLLKLLTKDYSVYVPVKQGDQRFYARYSEGLADMTIGEVRAFEPLKAFFFSARQRVAEDFKPGMPSQDPKPSCIVGKKACDLKGFKVQDHVFKGEDFEDPFYRKRRDETLIIASDCTCAIATCFCLALGVKPYPQEAFDLSLAEVKGGFVVESGSDKGEALLKNHYGLFEEASSGQISERDRRRERVVAEVEKNIKTNEVPAQEDLEGRVEKHFESKLWSEEAETCVECGACNTICPTCHCFLLYDQKDEKKMARLKIWDSCLLKNFARVAGGANPRPKLWMRLRNRF